MKRVSRVLALLLTVVLCVSGLLQNAPTASAASFSNSNLQKLAQYINTYGASSSDGKGKKVVEKRTSGTTAVYFTIQNQSGGLHFAMITEGTKSSRIETLTEFVLTESSRYISVDHLMLYFSNYKAVDAANTTKSIDKTTYTSTSSYSISGSGYYITNSIFAESFHDAMSTMCAVFDSYIYSRLGFGLKAIGFNSYNGLGGYGSGGCAYHVYNNSCDATCNYCGVTRSVTHTYSAGCDTTCNVCGSVRTATGGHAFGSWVTVDGNVHQRTCSSCNKIESESHKWNAGTITKQPTCAATGVKTYTCSVCGGTKTETIAKNSNHSYGSWTKVNDTTHQRACTLCGKTESANHSYDAGVVTKQPTCAATGVKTYTCKTCGGTKTETLAKTSNHTYAKGIKVDDDRHKHSCTTCGKEETVAHVWDAGTITLAPTLETTGLREHSCKDCDATKTVVVPKRANGDLNGDQNIDNKDVEYLLWHTLFPGSYPLELFADFNFDGNIDNKDVEYLLWHTLFPDSYPLEAK